MRVTLLRLRDFRGYESAEVELGPGITIVHGPNGAGKTNLLEGAYFACTGRSCRTSNERDIVRFGATACRAEAHVEGADGAHRMAVGFQPGEPKRLRVDGASVERMADAPQRPLVGVFLPDRLELVKGAPGLRRGHLDQVVAGLWPTRATTRRAYAAALAQRNALISRVRAGRASRDALPAWDGELARHAVALRDDRARAVDLLAEPFSLLAGELGLQGAAELRYRPRSTAPDAEAFAAELAGRLDGDLSRGFTAHGPHRDDLVATRDGRELRSFGSQGEQRIALLALLMAERAAMASTRGAPPLLLLDDVMSELDARRRALLVDRLDDGGQSVITTTDLGHVPGAERESVVRIAIGEGAALAAATPQRAAA